MIFLKNGLNKSAINSLYVNIRQSRDLSFHPGSSSKLNARPDLLYIHNLVIPKETLDIMGKGDWGSAKIFFSLILNAQSSPLWTWLNNIIEHRFLTFFYKTKRPSF